MYYDLLLRGITAEAYNQPASFYFFYALLGCFLPCLCLALNGSKIDFQKMNKYITISVLASAGVLTWCIYYQYGLTSFIDRIHLSVEGEGRVLSAGIISQMGVCLTAISFFNILYYKKKIILFTLAIIAGIALTVLGSTKGAAINVALILIILIFANLRQIRRTPRLTVWMAGIILVGLIYIPKINLDDINLFNRFQWLNERLNTGDELRLRAWKGGLNQFANHPVLGDQMFEHTMRGYPHNIFVEVLMATGYIGFIPFIVVLGVAFSKVVNVIRKEPEKSLIGLLFFSYFIQSLVSGGLYSSVQFWISLGVILSIKNNFKKVGH